MADIVMLPEVPWKTKVSHDAVIAGTENKINDLDLR